MKTFKLVLILTTAIIGPMVWMLALSNASTPLVAQYGIPACIAFAVGISVVSAWLIVGFIQEIKEM